MKKTIACCLAALIAVSFAGCTAVSRFEAPEDELAYSRVLYSDSSFVSEDDEDELFEDEVSEDEKSKESKPEEKTSHEEKKPESKQEKKTASAASNKASSKASSVSSKASEKKRVTSSAASSKSSKHTIIRQSDLKKNNSSKSTDTDSDTDTAQKKKNEQTASVGSFTVLDLSYNADKDYLDFGDDEPFIRKTMGEPLEVSEDGDLRCLTYEDCVITLKKLSEDTEPVLVRIFVPQESYYTTIKRIETESRRYRVIDAYGEPADITAVYPEAEEPSEQDPNSSIGNDTDIGQENDPSQDTETPIDTDTSDEDIIPQSDTDTAEELPEPLYEILTYSIGDKSFVLRIEGGRVVTMEYVWAVDT